MGLISLDLKKAILHVYLQKTSGRVQIALISKLKK